MGSQRVEHDWVTEHDKLLNYFAHTHTNTHIHSQIFAFTVRTGISLLISRPISIHCIYFLNVIYPGLLCLASPFPGLLSPGLPSPGPPLSWASPSPGPPLSRASSPAPPLSWACSPRPPLSWQVRVHPWPHSPFQSLLGRPHATLSLHLRRPLVSLWACFAEESTRPTRRCRADDSVRQISHKEAWVFISQTYLLSCVLLKIFKTRPRAKIKGLDLHLLG